MKAGLLAHLEVRGCFGSVADHKKKPAYRRASSFQCLGSCTQHNTLQVLPLFSFEPLEGCLPCQLYPTWGPCKWASASSNSGLTCPISGAICPVVSQKANWGAILIIASMSSSLARRLPFRRWYQLLRSIAVSFSSLAADKSIYSQMVIILSLIIP